MDHGKRQAGELYSLFEIEPSTRKKEKIPTPSETRWLYYRDTLRAVLDQTETIDEFMNIQSNRERWEHHIVTSKYPLGPIKDVPFSFKNPLINAHFRFVLSVLEVLGGATRSSSRNTTFPKLVGQPPISRPVFEKRIVENPKRRLCPFRVSCRNPIGQYSTIRIHFETPHHEPLCEVLHHELFAQQDVDQGLHRL